jgi:hypothetical protein
MMDKLDVDDDNNTRFQSNIESINRLLSDFASEIKEIEEEEKSVSRHENVKKPKKKKISKRKIKTQTNR